MRGVRMSETTSPNVRRILKVVVAVGVIAVGILIALCLRDSSPFSNSEGEVSWLYSQSADAAELDDLGDGNYRLILRDIDPHTIQFSDRPDRLVEIIDTARLVHHWEELFADSAPNAVLIEHEPDGATDSLVVVLTNPVYDLAAGTLTYDVEILADEHHPERLVALVDHHQRPPVTMRAVSLFIDSVHNANGSGVDHATIAGPGAQRLLDMLAGSDLGGGVHLVSADVSVAADDTVTGTAVISFDTAGFELSAQLSMKDAQNWSLSVTTQAASVWRPTNLPSLTVDPSSFSGSISMVAGAVGYDIVGATHTWNMANGVTYVSTPELSADCPLAESKCPTGVDGPYLSMDGSLNVAGVANTLTLTGAITTDGDWARFDGTAGDVTFDGFGITNATLTVWHGQRPDSYDPNMDLPSLATLNSGMDLEFCGGFTIPIPGHSNSASDGCARWSPSGVVLGQIGVDVSVTGSMDSTGAVAQAGAEVKGLAWTNLSSEILGQLPSPEMIMSGVHAALENAKVKLAGKASLPGVAANALNLDLQGAESYSFDVIGEISKNGFSLSAVLPTNIHIGSEPFRTDITSITATIAAERGDGASFSIGTTGAATVGYSPNTRPITTSVQLVAATSPSVGMTLSVSATGTKAAGDTGGDGLTSGTRLSNPVGATYLWPDQFGIKGMNLWSMTVQIAFQDGSPALGYTSTTYLDPNGAQTGSVLSCTGACDGSDWLVGTLGFNISYTNPCMAYAFSSGSGTSGFSIDDGAIVASTFKIGVAPVGCSIQTGSTQQSLPVGFAGFQFTATFGSATLNVATQVSVDGFIFTETLSNLTLAGMTYETIALSITINDSGSDITFTAVMTSGMGDMAISSAFSSGSSGVKQSIDATLTDWSWASANVDIEQLHFASSASIPTTSGGCASFSAAADGNVRIGGSTLILEKGTSITITCKGVQQLMVDLTYIHTGYGPKTVSENLVLEYPKVINGVTYFYGEASFSYTRYFKKGYKNWAGKTKHFAAEVEISIGMSVSVNTKTPSKSGFAFWGGFDASRVGGSLECSLPPDSTDFSCSGEVSIDPSWAGKYHYDWNGL